MDVPNRDKMIYSRLKGDDERREVERLLPQPEQPQLPTATKLDELVRPDEHKMPTLLLPPNDGAAGGMAAADSRLPHGAAMPTENPPTTMPAKPEVAQPDAARTVAPPPKQEQLALARPVPAAPTAKAPAAGTQTKPSAVATGRFQVQLLAARSEADARTAWQRLQSKNGDVLGGLSYSVQRADLGSQGVFYRLRAGPIADEGKAKSICSALSGRSVSCLIIKPKA
jgi:cell division septation protein DedD